MSDFIIVMIKVHFSVNILSTELFSSRARQHIEMFLSWAANIYLLFDKKKSVYLSKYSVTDNKPHAIRMTRGSLFFALKHFCVQHLILICFICF